MRFLICLFFISLVLGTLNSNSYYQQQFNKYKEQYHKVYSSRQEMRYRLQMFAYNMNKIEIENKKNHSYELGWSPFIDMSNDEFKSSKLCGCLLDNSQNKIYRMRSLNILKVPDHVDWREEGYVNEVKNQLFCGSCWAFSAVAAMEGVIAMKEGALYNLSEQQLVDCDSQSLGCNGGLMDYAFEYVIGNEGICSEEDYPYTAQDDDCKSDECTPKGKIINYVDVVPKDGDALLEAISQNVVSVAVEADSFIFQAYKSGIVDSEECGTKVNHGVAAVGYGLEENRMYYIIRNSWGKDWGDNGYIKILHTHFDEGICGINLAASYPVAE
ncbi:hypothetical protein WA158_003981 [Blastocystis sp. Blastoise]